MTSYEELKSKYQSVLVDCEICNSSNTLPFQQFGRSAEPGVYGPVPVRICSECGHKMINPRFEDAFYEAYYEAMYREIAFGSLAPSDEYIEQQKRRGKGVLDWVNKFDVEQRVMLDHGCASGCTMLSWLDKGWVCKGIDPHRPSVDAGRTLGLDIEVASGERLPFRNESIDLVLSLGSLEHVYDLNQSMAEIRRVLSRNGSLVIRWRSNTIFGSPLEYYNHNHYRFFTPETWRAILYKFGFEVISETDEKLEGWESYEYIIARKVEPPIDSNEVKLRADLKNRNYCVSAKKELAELQAVRQRYYTNCQKFLELESQASDARDCINRVVESQLTWKFLGGEPEDVVARSKLEATKFVEEFEAGRVV